MFRGKKYQDSIKKFEKNNLYDTAEALGLKKVNDATEQPDNACTQGKIKKIIHLIKVEK